MQDARQKQFASGRRYKAPTPTQIANEVKRCKADRSVVMVLLGHLPIWTPSAYSETVTPAGSMTWRTGHADGTLTITVGERIAICPSRPCALCRRQDYRRFQQKWKSAHRLDMAPLAREMDAVLHQQRLTNDRCKRLHMLPNGSLPVGTMVLLDDGPALRTDDGLRHWSFSGYDPLPLQVAGSRILGVLTPPAIVAVLRQGYRPHFHPTARALRR